MSNTYNTIITQQGAAIPLVSANDWMKVTIIMHSTGPVVIGATDAVRNASGALLVEGVPVVVDLPPGERLYAYSDAPNTLTVITVRMSFWAGTATSITKTLTAIARAAMPNAKLPNEGC